MSARNSPCPCGSGKKYKVCCMRNQADHAGPDDTAGIALLAMPGEKPPPTPDEIAFRAGPTCGQCVHWRQQPKQPVDLMGLTAQIRAVEESAAFRAAPFEQQHQLRKQHKDALERAKLHNSGADLAEARQGECRRVLLTQVVSVQQLPDGRRAVDPISYYPGGIGADWPCCGQFERREEKPAAVLTEG